MKSQIIAVALLATVGVFSSFVTDGAQVSKIDGMQGVKLDTLTMPAEANNIHVVKLSSDVHSSQFVVFVRQFVPAHKHMSHSESVYVLAGEGEFTMDGKTMAISPGHFVYIPQGVAHSVVTTSKTPLKVLSVQAPQFFGKDRVPVKD